MEISDAGAIAIDDRMPPGRFVIVYEDNGRFHFPVLSIDFARRAIRTYATFEEARASRDAWIDEHSRDEDGDVDDDDRGDSDTMLRIMRTSKIQMEVGDLMAEIDRYLKEERDAGDPPA